MKKPGWKQIGAALAAGIILLCVPGVSQAEDKETVKINKPGFQLQVPKAWATVTSDMEPDDPVFSQLGVDGKDMLSQLESQNVLLDSMNMDEKTEFNITCISSEEKITHLTQFSDEDVEKFAENLTKEEKGSPVKYDGYTLYDHPQAKFIVSKMELGEGNGYGQQYFTIVNHNSLRFQIMSFNGPLSKETEKQVKEIIDSVVFDSLEEAEPLEIGGRTNVFSKWFTPNNILLAVIAAGVVILGADWIGKRKKK